MNKRRLLKLAEFLETAELPGKFSMTWWCDETVNGRPACGTDACALGWAATIPSFQRAGLKLSNRSGAPIFEGWVSIDAGSAFFEIDRYQSEKLFCPADMSRLTGKRGRRIVAKRIRKLVASAP